MKQLSTLLSRRGTSSEEAWLYYRRACLAAAEERYDVALIFCRKSLDLDARNLPTRLLVAQIEHRALNDLDSAVVAYQKVITLAGYDGANPYCAAARAGLEELIAGVRSSVSGNRAKTAETSDESGTPAA